VTQWRPAPAVEAPGPGAVSLWRAALDLPAEHMEQLVGLLSGGEQARAVRLRSGTARRRFAAARGLLRELLGASVGQPPAELRFAYGPQGKPGLNPPGRLRFNLSHCDGLALYALALDRELGVDLERVRPGRDALALARRHFAPAELAQLAALSPWERAAAFSCIWTCKEAYLKATGRGIWAGGLASCEIGQRPGGGPELPGPQAARWTLWSVDPGPQLAAAVVVEGRDLCLHCFDYPGDGALGPLR